jgi:hypothetical protein
MLCLIFIVLPKQFTGKTCCSIQTHYHDSESTSICFYYLWHHALLITIVEYFVFFFFYSIKKNFVLGDISFFCQKYPIIVLLFTFSLPSWQIILFEGVKKKKDKIFWSNCGSNLEILIGSMVILKHAMLWGSPI